VGYDENVKGYKLMDPNTHKIINSRDVVFLENQFLKNIYQEPNEKQITVLDELEEVESLYTRSPDVISNVDEEFHESTERIEKVSATERDNESGSRRSSRKWKPVVREGYVSYLAVEETDTDPSTLDEALNSQQRDKWLHAIDQELESLIKNDTWEVTRKPDNAKVLQTKWVFKQKRAESGETKYKTRLVIQRYA